MFKLKTYEQTIEEKISVCQMAANALLEMDSKNIPTSK